jgi:rhomboid protease GluP
MASQGEPKAEKPLLTVALLVALTVAFGLECWAADSFAPNAHVLFALGGSSRDGVKAGEWFRVLTATLLHGDVIHLICNGVALWVGGMFVEMFVGKRWMFTIYTASGVTGSLLGLAINDASLVSVGASGAIMGVLAAAFVLTLRLQKGPVRTSIQMQLGRILIPSLIPFATQGGGRVDVAAHIGGAIGGAAVAGLLALMWNMDREARPLRRVATALTTFSSILFITAIGGALPGYAARAEDARLDPKKLLVQDGAIPEDVHEAASTVAEWGKQHDRDPRVHYYRAVNHLDDRRMSDAERELRAALAEKAILKKFFDRKLEVTIRTLLAAILRDQEKFDDARREAAPICNAGPGGTVPVGIAKMGLCAPR